MAGWIVPGFAEERELGSGASGRVVAAVHVVNGTRVAIKYLSPRLFGDPGFLARFRREAQLLRSLADPHVVRLFDYVEVPDQGAAIVMELVDGVSLHEMITGQGPAGAESALLVLKGSLLGLAATHAAGVVHGDYKPENVLVDGQGESKLTDFGVAVRAGHDAPAGGTPHYMAPEQWNGTPATPAGDIYAATAVFFECLTGVTPFSGGMAQLAAQHAAAAVPVDRVDEPLRELIARGMAKDPAARPASAAELVTELEATAAAAYGPDWESHGRVQLAARAAALLLLLVHAPGAAVASGTGTTSVTTTLSHARRAVNVTRRVLSAGHGAGGAAVGVVVAAAVAAAVVLPGGKPMTTATINGSIGAVAATSGSDVWAVGCAPSLACNKALITHFNGTTWAQLPSPGSGPTDFGALWGVTATSASNAWATGWTSDRAGGNNAKLILHWDGTAWTRVPSPGPARGRLTGVAATSAGNAWTVGYNTEANNGTSPVILHWDGANWAQVPAPAGTSGLFSVSAVSARSAWAAGWADDPSRGTRTTLILRWDGTAWARVPSPTPGNEQGYVNYVTAASDGTAWAAGYAIPNSGSSAERPLLMRWDGSTWQAVPVPGAAANTTFYGLAATPAGTAWAVGCTTIKPLGSCHNGLVLQWNGTSWARVEAPAGFKVGGVVVLSATDALAVGSGDPSRIFLTRWNGETWK